MSRPDPVDAAQVVDINFSTDMFSLALKDGRTLSVPIDWFPRLSGATAEQRDNWCLEDEDRAIHWPDVDEDISVAGLLRGFRAPRKKPR